MLGLLLFYTLYCVSDFILTNYFEKSEFINDYIQKQGQSLRDFIDNNDISSKDLQKLKKWEKKQPVILLELYSGDQCIYSSFDDNTSRGSHYNAEDENNEGMIPIQLTDDTDVQAVLYSDVTYKYYVIGVAVSAMISLILFILLFLHGNRRLIRYICRLNEEVQILEGGNLEYEVSVEGNDEITALATSMNRMRESFRNQIEAEQEVHRKNNR